MQGKTQDGSSRTVDTGNGGGQTDGASSNGADDASTTPLGDAPNDGTGFTFQPSNIDLAAGRIREACKRTMSGLPIAAGNTFVGRVRSRAYAGVFGARRLRQLCKRKTDCRVAVAVVVSRRTIKQ
jgi:hypothetical protein